MFIVADAATAVVSSPSSFCLRLSPRDHLHVVGMLRFMSKTKSLPTSFFSVLVSTSVFVALSTVFHSINSPDNSPFSHSVLLVLSLPSWSFLCLPGPFSAFLVLSTMYLFMKVSFSPDIISSGSLGSEYQLTNLLLTNDAFLVFSHERNLVLCP